jgi:hypothetical protein
MKITIIAYLLAKRDMDIEAGHGFAFDKNTIFHAKRIPCPTKSKKNNIFGLLHISRD